MNELDNTQPLEKCQIDELWTLTLSKLKMLIGNNDFDLWFTKIYTKNRDGQLRILTKNKVTYNFVKEKYIKEIEVIFRQLQAETINTGGQKYHVIMEFVYVKPTIDSVAENAGLHKEEPDIYINRSYRPKKTKSTFSYIDDESSEGSDSSSHQDGYYKKSNSYNLGNYTDVNGKLDDYLPKDNHELLKSSGVIHQASKLNSNYTFENLIRGNSNQLAYIIGMHVTHSPGHRNHNPLFIYGKVGLGKTHLMQAIGNERYRINPNSKIRYLHANDYIQDVINASLNHSFESLKEYYCSLDLLLMDDIQFIAGDKTKTQEAFFYTFNTLLDRGKQIVMTCDTFHKNINNLNERLVSRFASGLTVEIQTPELEMRVAILKSKALQNNINLDDDVAFFIGQNIKSNVRELEGALNKVIYQAQFTNNSEINIDVARSALSDIIMPDLNNVSVDHIQKVVCDFYKLRLQDLLSTQRVQSISRPRQIAMYLCKKLTQLSLPAIGKQFGGRDHTTVLHAQRTITNLSRTDATVIRDLALLSKIIEGGV